MTLYRTSLANNSQSSLGKDLLQSSFDPFFSRDLTSQRSVKARNGLYIALSATTLQKMVLCLRFSENPTKLKCVYPAGQRAFCISQDFLQ